VAENIPLADHSIDLITSNNGINNVKNIETVFSECERISKKGGQFIYTMNTDKSMFEFYQTFETVLSDLGLNKEITSMHQHIADKRPPISKMISLIQKHGFLIKDLEYNQFDYRFTDGTAMLNHYFIRLAFMDSWIKLIPKDKVEEVFNLVESHLNKQAHLLGGIKLSVPYVTINAIKQ
jgi:SAM-dependent methyltransferase